MLVIGLTGGIGSGKTTVTNMFSSYGVPIVDADVIARELTEPNQTAFDKIIHHFGRDILMSGGTLDRAKLRTIIFSNHLERKWLENLLHPLIYNKMEHAISEHPLPYVIAVVPLLLEVEFYGFINRILVIDTSSDLQIKRIISRDHVSEHDVIAILKSQATSEQRKVKAHDIIINDGTLDDLQKQVLNLHQKYLEMAQHQS